MAKIALRAYNNEISEMVDHGQIDEAIAHGRHILETYPRHLETYRLLGKAFLEGQRYGDAADILQRVLSSVPEDFISHVGMSIIREDEGNLDAAIWHMERAFENQPSNQAIQDELRRLYGRRDGHEPPRIRLTRGALARMYSHGNLYDQAVAELLAALTEDPQRPDLQALLAEMYRQTGKKADAAETCTKLLAKLPYCLAANRLLSLLLEGTDRAEEVEALRRRWYSLEPYAAGLPNPEGDPASVPDDAVSVDHLEYDPTEHAQQASQSQPNWASSLGVNLTGSQEEEAPDWLSSGSSASAPEFFPSVETSEWNTPAAEETEAAPDWLASMGGIAPPAEESQEEAPPDWMSAELPSESPAEAAQESDDVPDWMATTSPESSAPESEMDAESDTPDWLSASGPDSASQAAGEEESLPDWLAETASTDKELSPTNQPQAAEDLSWLTSEPEAEADPVPEAELPDFLKEAGWEAGSGEAEEPASILDDSESGELAPGDVPDWMSALKPPAETEVDEAFAAALGVSAAAMDPKSVAPGEDTLANFLQETQPTETAADDDWLAELTHAEPQGEMPMTPSSPADDSPEWLNKPVPATADDEDMNWLDDLTSEVGDQLRSEAAAAEPQATAVPATADDEDMNWLDDLTSEVGDQLRSEAVAAEPQPTAVPAAADDEDMNWLDDLTSEVGDQLRSEAAAAEPQATAVPATADDEDMNWLDDLTSEVGEQLSAEDASAGPLPDTSEDLSWLTNLEDAPASPEPASEDNTPDWLKAIEGDSLPTTPVQAPEDLDDALAWMENLAAKQGVAEEELVTNPESRKEDMPDWVRQAAAAPAPPPASPATDTSIPEIESEPEAYQPSPPAEEIPSAPAGSGTDLSEVEGMDDALAWLEGLAEKQGIAEEELVTKPERRTGELPKWAQVEAEMQGVPDPVEVTPQPSELDWLNDLAEQAPESEENAAEDWLKSLEGQAPPASDAGTGPPSWLDEIADEEEAAPAVPEWLSGSGEEPQASQSPEEAPDLLPERRAAPDPGSWLPENELIEDADRIAEAAPVEPVATLPSAPIQPEPAARPSPVRTPSKAKTATSGKSDDTRLAEARQLLADGQTESAAEQYGKLVSRGKRVEDVITDLREALRRHPVDVGLWQALGDAYTRHDLLQDAMDAYTKAEDLLRF